ncbi:NfeD family protein [bacterium]|nr:NfeD family protein [bacterium]MBU1956845.1 NfeD family protein [bacterium]
MLEFLTNNLLWWHWIIFGIFLITFEMFIGTFFMLGLGLAAMIVGVIDKLFGISLEMELSLWMLFSLVSIFLWFKYLKDSTVETSGQSNYALEMQGVVQEAILANGRGSVKFDTPVLGNTLWHATSKHDIPVSSRVKIVAIKGQLIEVEKLDRK